MFAQMALLINTFAIHIVVILSNIELFTIHELTFNFNFLLQEGLRTGCVVDASFLCLASQTISCPSYF